jgi:uncharacterized protein Yka (UPF0111/DUF47 family)
MTEKEITMNQKPFTPNMKKEVEKLTRAYNKVLEAVIALEQAQKNADNWAEYETIGHFKSQLKEFLSCDNGEAGFESYVEAKWM